MVVSIYVWKYYRWACNSCYVPFHGGSPCPFPSSHPAIRQLYSDNVAVRRNIMGLVANLAEVQEIRSILMSGSVLAALRSCLHDVRSMPLNLARNTGWDVVARTDTHSLCCRVSTLR